MPSTRTLSARPLLLGGLWLLAPVAAAAPDPPAPRPACVAADTCTLVRPVGRVDGVETVALIDRTPPRAAANQPFAGWMPWARAPASVRSRSGRGESVRLERITGSGTFLLRAVPGVRVAEEPDALLVLVTFDPLRTGTPPALPEPIAIARERKLLTAEQESRAGRESQAQRARTGALTDAWAAYARTPSDRAARERFLEALGSDGSALDPGTFLTQEQRTALRRAGLALDGRIVLEDANGPDLAFRLRVEAVPLERVVREWNAGLRALVNPLERVPRPVLLVANAHRHDEVSFTLDVRADDDRMSQVVHRLLALPGISTDGKELPPPAL